jgi:hypothetical protein
VRSTKWPGILKLFTVKETVPQAFIKHFDVEPVRGIVDSVEDLTVDIIGFAGCEIKIIEHDGANVVNRTYQTATLTLNYINRPLQ